MKTEIYIHGGINGNYVLRNALMTADCEEKKGMFNAIVLTFPTRKAARKALITGHKSIRAIEGKNAKWPLVRYSPKNALSYDASTATIIY